MTTTKDEIVKQALNEMGGGQPEEIKQAVEKLTTDIYEKGMLPKDAIGLSDGMIEGMYSFGYRLYNTGKYDKAVQLFRLLVMLDPTQEKFSLGLAACFHMMKNYHNASTTYLLCGIINNEDPLPHFHASDCYVEMQQPDLAIASLEICLERCGNRPEYAALKNRASIAIDNLRKKISEGVESIAKTA